jgi:uncharacterized protein YciI
MAHLVHQFSLREEGKMRLFGPITDECDYIGIGVLTVPTREEAEALVQRDPGVLAGRLAFEIHPWFTTPGDALP